MFTFYDLVKKFAPQIGIDLGTSNTPIFVRGKGIVFTEPSFVARNNTTGKIIAVGESAKKMHGRTPANISVIRPLRDGVIANFEIAYEMMRHLLRKALPNNSLIKPRVIVGVPSDCTPVEQRAVEEATLAAGAGQVVLASQPLLAALGSLLPIKDPVGSMVVDIGGGTTEIAILSLGGIVLSQSLRIAGDEMDEAVMNYIKKNYNLLVGERTAEAVKIQVGSAYPIEKEITLEVRGRDVFSGLPRLQTISSGDIREAVTEPIVSIVEAVRVTLEQAPPELIADIMEYGIVVTGGGSLLEGLDQLIEKTMGVPCRRPADPLHSVALGAGFLFEDPGFLDQIGGSRKALWEQPAEAV